MSLTPVEDIKKWAEKYGINLNPKPCSKCDKIFPYTKPIAFKNYRGVTQDMHDCGENYIQIRVVPSNEETIEKWNNIKDIK